MKLIGVECNNDYLFQKIKLILSEVALCERIHAEDDVARFDLLLLEDASVACLRVAGRDDSISVPFERGALLRLVSDEHEAPPLFLESKSHSAILRGHRIKMTELEYKLLDLLVSGGGHPVSKEEILKALWDPGTDAGVVNVYVHYLREKLEQYGERVIISVRGAGYKIDGRFIGKEDANA